MNTAKNLRLYIALIFALCACSTRTPYERLTYSLNTGMSVVVMPNSGSAWSSAWVKSDKAPGGNPTS